MKILHWDENYNCDILFGEARIFTLVLDNGMKFEISSNSNKFDSFMISGDLSLVIKPGATNTIYVSGIK